MFSRGLQFLFHSLDISDPKSILTSRANYAGAMIGAASGVESVPKDWITKVSGVDKITDMILSAAQKA